MSLQDEIIERSSKIFRDSYQMSIGELINLYRDGEMDIHPEFQRVFRWSESQKTRLIESIMLNIPIPSIFVSQNDEGIWDVIDGVQRLSTIFQFVGVYKDEDNKLIEPLVLQKTDYLPSFEGMMWDNPNKGKSFTKEQQLAFKRARIDVIIVKKESDINTKYELFQRLNTGGSQLSDQEVRNCLMIMTNRDFYFFIDELSKNYDFNACVVITDRKEDEQFKLELILRLLIAVNANLIDFTKYYDLQELLDRETINIVDGVKDGYYNSTKDKFERTFKLLNRILGEDSFRRYIGDNKHKGSFLVAAFQGIATGIFFNIDKVELMDDEKIKDKVRSFYNEKIYVENTKIGARAVPRFKYLTNFGKEYFRNED